MSARPDATIEALDISAYEVPTDEPESDGTLEWSSTTIVIVEARAGTTAGLGYTYADRSAAVLIESKLRSVVERRDAMDLAAIWTDMGAAIRNAGRPGAGMMAVSAVDIAPWDLKSRLLRLSVADLVHPAHGALGRKEALYWAERFRYDWNVSWFEEPVSSADFEGLRLLRDRGPAGLDIAAGEYGYVLADFRTLMEAGAVDCLQAGG